MLGLKSCWTAFFSSSAYISYLPVICGKIHMYECHTDATIFVRISIGHEHSWKDFCQKGINLLLMMIRYLSVGNVLLNMYCSDFYPTLKFHLSATWRFRFKSSSVTRRPSRVLDNPGDLLPSGAAT